MPEAERCGVVQECHLECASMTVTKEGK